MRKSLRFAAVFSASLLLSGTAFAVNLTDQNVKNACGGKLQSATIGDTTGFGCDKKCGKTMCTYNCCSGSKCGEQGCHGYALRIVGGGEVKRSLPGSVLSRLRALSRGQESGSDMPPHALSPRVVSHR